MMERSARQSYFLLFAGLYVLSAVSARALDVHDVAGHAVQLVDTDGDQSLKVDGKVMVKAASIRIDDFDTVGGVAVVIGEEGAGADYCGDAPFVVSLPENRPPKVDRLESDCMFIDHKIDKDNILFSTGDLPGERNKRWSWTASGGFIKLRALTFAPDAGSGWNTFTPRPHLHPADTLKNADIYAAAKRLLGKRLGDFEAIIIGVGDGGFEGTDYFGSACMRPDCDDNAAMIYVSSSQHRVYLAWKPADRKIVVVPPVGAWSGSARKHLKEWASAWP